MTTDLALEALRIWGGNAPPRLITERENVVWDIRLADGQRAALRLHRMGYQDDAAIRSELWWCAQLAAAGLPVPAPVPTPAGDLLVTLSSGRRASVMAWVEGAPIGAAGVLLEGPVAAQCRALAATGTLLARVHQVTDRLVLPAGFSRPAWDAAGLAGDAPLWGDFTAHPGLTPAERDILLNAKAEIFRSAEIAQKSGDYGLIHADVLRENVLSGANGYSLIDFDDSGFGLRAYDPGTMLSQCLREPGLPDLARALAEGYRSVRPLDEGLLAVMTLARCCASVGWAATRLAADHPVQRSHIDRATGFARRVLDGRADPWG